MSGCTFFFSDDIEGLNKAESEKELNERLKNTKKDFEQSRDFSQENLHDQSIEFIKQIMLAFLPDKIVCCLKKKGEIFAVNVIKEVYKVITKGIEINRLQPLSIKNFMKRPITVSENNSNKNEYTRNLKEWCWYGFERIKTFLPFDVNEHIRVEFMLPYEVDVCSGSIKKLLEESPLFKSSFFSELKKEDLKNIKKDLLYFGPFSDVFEGEVDLGRLMPYKENMMRRIEKEIRDKVGKEHQVWIYHHFKNNEYSKKRGTEDLKFIFEDFGFYVSFTTEMKDKIYWKHFRDYSEFENTIFSKIKGQLAHQLGIEKDKIKGEKLREFKDAFYNLITEEENFPDFKFPPEKDEGKILPKKVYKFKEIFLQELKKVFDVYWDNRTKRFYQSSEVGVASIPRFTRLPEFLIDLSEKAKDPRNKSYEEDKVKSDNPKEKKHYNIIVETEKFLFIPQVISEYTVFPVIMNNVYWGVILVFWLKSEKEGTVERGRNLYNWHREIFKQLRKNLLNYAERGIISEFENYTRDKVLRVKDTEDFDKAGEQIELESRRNPLILNIDIFRFEKQPCRCPIPDKEDAGKELIVLVWEKDWEKIERFSRCIHLKKRKEKRKEEGKQYKDLDYKNWKFVILFPSGKKLRVGDDKNVCTIFSGKRPPPYYPPTIRLNCMAINDYIDTAWEIVLSEIEKKKLYIRDAAVGIMLDTFSHNIAAHSMRHLLNLLNERGQKQLDVWEKLSLEFSFEEDTIRKILDVKDDDEWAEQPMGIQRYIGFLREKSTFWNGLISEIYTSWGTTINLYEVIKKFIDNNLYVGSIASDLDVDGVEFHIGIDGGAPKKWGISTLYNYKYPNKNTMRFYENEWQLLPSRKDKLELEKRELYFPGGLIGLHAFYTILENTIRNAKFVRVEERIIPLHILIRKEGNFFEIQAGIDHKSKDVGKIDNIKKLLDERIIDKENKVKKGGVSQIKISAAMLRGYNLIRANEPLTNFNPPLIGIESEFLEKEGKVFWRFYAWKASTYVLFNEGFLKNIKKGQENPLRFKFLIVSPAERKAFERIELDRFPIRIVHVEKRKKNYSEQELYLQWLKEWTEGETMTLIYKVPGGSDECVVWNGEEIRQPDPELSNPSLTFSFFHSGEHAEDYSYCVNNHLIGTRSHGIFKKQFLGEQILTFNQQNIPSLIETVYTGITIVDNEIFRLWSKISQRFGTPPEEIQPYVNQTLRLKILKEVNSTDKLWEMVNENPKKHILIVHLSMLEDLYGKEKEDRHQFMKEAFRYFHYVILTTGRGRENAYAELNREYKTKTRFIYRNQFEKAFDMALEVIGEEVFMVKYFLVKILLGG